LLFFLQNITSNHDPSTSDDSGRASERLTVSSVAQRDPDSSRDRLSDASSRCSSGKGYIVSIIIHSLFQFCLNDEMFFGSLG
jgi:hypothetical protein